jgi:capsid protein
MQKQKRKKSLLKPADRRKVNELANSGRAEEALKYAQSAAKLQLFMNAAGNIDAIKSTSKRRTPLSQTCSMDAEFGGEHNRDYMVATARDLVLNFSLARGLIQTHVNNVVGSGPRIQFKTKDTEWNMRAEKFFSDWGKQCDIRGVLNWGRFVRMVERRTVVDGDVGIILAKGQKLQGIESDRIANPPDKTSNAPDWVYGVNVDEILRPKAYGIYSRGNANNCSSRRPSDFRTVIKAKNFVHSFDPDRFDQVRGMSALISAINDLQDSREALEAIKGTIKLENILALVMKLNQTSSQTYNPLGDITGFDINDSAGGSESRKEVKINQGVNTIEIGPDESVEALEKKTPGSMFNDWMLFQIRLAGLALDMPLEIAFLYFTRGSFSSLKGSIGQYHSAVRVRRSRLEDQVLNRIANWVIQGAIKRWRFEEASNVPMGERRGLQPPSEEINPTTYGWQWDMLPFLEPDKQIKSDTEEYKAAVTTMQDMCGKRGKDWEDVQEQRKREALKARELAEESDLPEQLFIPQVLTPGQEVVGGDNNDSGEDDDE